MDQNNKTISKQQKSVQKWVDKKLQNDIIPYVNEMNQWKKLMKIPQNIKVYVVGGGNQVVRNYFSEMEGWMENSDKESQFYDFKWTVKRKQIPFGNIKKGAQSNHFQNAISVLKQFFNDKIEYNDKVQTSVQVLQRKFLEKQNQNTISDKEWNILSADELSLQELKHQKHIKYLQQLDLNINQRKQNIQKDINKIQDQIQIMKKGKSNIQKQKIKKEDKSTSGNNQQQIQGSDQQQDQEIIYKNKMVKNDQKQMVSKILGQIQIELGNQYDLIQENNIWIIKPGNSSRGRGIQLSSNLVELQEIYKTKMNNWIVQKYIENPMIIHQRKFDIRVWVLIKNISQPLVIWKYNDFYIRLSGESYNSKNLNSQQSHLTNNSVTKNSKNKQIGHQNMLFYKEFFQYIKENNIKEVQNIEEIETTINSKINSAIINSLQVCKNHIKYDQGQFELIGYDFMIDDKFNVWLIEINASPDLSFSTDVTEYLVQDSLPGLLDIVLDNQVSKLTEHKKWVRLNSNLQQKK